MLHKITCDKFKVQPFEFKEGLNCVLGDDIGSNSIGKSTFLMIIDFVFGGNDYITLDKEIISIVGPHYINFEFKFSEKIFYFKRSTENPNIVEICDNNYQTIEKQSLDEYLVFLKNMYNIANDVSVRNSIGRYSRIFPKDNLDLNKPLNIVKKESDKSAVLALLKLFNSYNKIANLLLELKNIEEKRKSLKKAQKYSFIPNITEKKYNINIKMIQNIQNEINEVRETIIQQSVNIETLMSSEMLFLRKKKNYYMSNINYIKSKIDNIIQNNISTNKTNLVEYDKILKFFPTINIEEIKKIDNFHFEISKIIKSEIKLYKEELLNELEYNQNCLLKINNRIATITNANQDTQYALERFTSLSQKLDNIKKENESYENFKSIEKEFNETHKKFIEEQLKQLIDVQDTINTSLNSLNNYIYNGARVTPKLELEEKRYNYNSLNDNGTGIKYKNLVILDMAILNLTTLPCVIHDSVLLKQIEDTAMEKITEIYDKSNKQIFIALDKVHTYTKSTQKILFENVILNLSKENKLFNVSTNI